MDHVAGVVADGTMTEPDDELYFRWLCSQVDDPIQRHPHKTHWNLLRQLYTTEFVWMVPNDDNRLEDGRDLRSEYLGAKHVRVEAAWMTMGCSMLEMLIALARRLSFETGATVRGWFWEMLHNLELYNLVDSVDYDKKLVDEIIETVIYRTYRPDGRGGLFPLRYPKEDQRNVEIWYQQSAYLTENGG